MHHPHLPTKRPVHCEQHAFDRGCLLCELGTKRSPRAVYLQCGFDWVSGGVMRRIAPDRSGDVNELFTAQQPTRIRPVQWGDMPGLTHLLTQPIRELMLDYPRGLLSPKYAPMSRCVSNFSRHS